MRIKLLDLLLLLLIIRILLTSEVSFGIPFSPVLTFLIAVIASIIILDVGVKKEFLLLLVMLIASSFLSIAFTYKYSYSLSSVITHFIRWYVVISIPFCFLGKNRLTNSHLLSVLFYCMIIPSVFMCSYYLYSGGYKEFQGLMRLSKPFSNPNSLGFFSFICMFSLILHYVVVGKNKILSLCLFGFFFFILIKTGSMTSFIGLLAFIASCLTFFFYKKSYTRIFLPIIILFSIAIVIYALFDILETRLVGVIDVESGGISIPKTSSLYWRYMAWKTSLMFVDYKSILFGVGIGVTGYALEINTYFSNLYYFDAPGAHNDYVTIFVDFGILGLIILFFWLKKYVKLSRSKKFADKIVFSMIVGFSLSMSTDNFLASSFGFLLIFIFSSFKKEYSLDR